MGVNYQCSRCRRTWAADLDDRHHRSCELCGERAWLRSVDNMALCRSCVAKTIATEPHDAHCLYCETMEEMPHISFLLSLICFIVFVTWILSS